MRYAGYPNPANAGTPGLNRISSGLSMFNDKPYSAVNREERFYCALFAHALLSSEALRQRFAEFVAARLDVALDPASLQVYLETAALRDYWYDLGSATKYTAETHARRRTVLDAILRTMEIDPSVIDTSPFFWSSGLGSKLWFPGRWSTDKLKEAGLTPLVQVRWAFNAKPDMLLLSPRGALMIEAKVESSEGSNDSGYDQLLTQELIIRLWRELIPGFSSIPIQLTTLKLRRDTNGITWSDLLNQLKGTDVDDFTQTCFQRLVQYSPSTGA
jgi:hypothetical protein